MKIYLASDHAGFELKEAVKDFLLKNNHEVDDFGPKIFDQGDDYPDYIVPCARKVSEDAESFGIVFGGSGQGEAIVANRISGIRAVVVYSKSDEIVKLSREHNNANILSIGARFMTKEDAFQTITLWLATPYSKEERHERRLLKIEQLIK